MKTSIEELILWWNNKNTYRQKQYCAQEIIDKAQFLLAEERAAQDKPIIVDLVCIKNKSEESLPILADRKGYMGSMHISERPSGWRIVFSPGNTFVAATYAECEAKAREYLNNLPV